tara:strand:- start:2324 stop:2863 length:540 start_codon:yes stop_codon:yes gene_type:complete
MAGSDCVFGIVKSMDAFSIFLLLVCKRVNARDLSHEEKTRIITKIVNNADQSGIFNPLEINECEDEEEEDEKGYEIADEEESNIAAYQMERSELIVRKQKELGIEPETPSKEQSISSRFGRSRLHEAILISDEGLVRQYIEDGDNAAETDNNGNTPYDIALLHENMKMINLLESLHAIF